MRSNSVEWAQIALREPCRGGATRGLAVALVAFLVGATTGSAAIDMDHVASVPAFFTVLSDGNGIDVDRDAAREFVIERRDVLPRLEFYESAGADAFSLVHVLDLSTNPTFSGYFPRSVGDPDGDGLDELLVWGRTGNTWYVRLYESASASSYPTVLIWELANWAARCRIADTDNDGRQEIVFGGNPNFQAQYWWGVYENTGDNSYVQTALWSLPVSFLQDFEVLNDIDGDGRDEILNTTVGRVYAHESIGDNSYQQVWTRDLIYTDGQPVNANALVDGGDLDGDGKKEFLVGGLKTVGAGGGGALSVLFLFEAVANDDVQVVATLTGPIGSESRTSVNVADVDGDGVREIVIGRGINVRIYHNVGDNAWTEIWSANVGHYDNQMIGAGDHDRDGKAEIIFRETETSTGIWEIDPADAVDQDADGLVDAIDNCPTISNSGQADADADTVGDACDNCVHASNPTQGAAVLGQPIQALDGRTFGWGAAAEVLYARGHLALVSTYTVDVVQAIPLTTSFADSTDPAAGEGFYYLVRPDCPVGSWQSSVGAEPNRDSALP